MDISRKWKTAKSEGKYLFSIKAMSKVFRAKYVGKLKSKVSGIEKRLIDALFKKQQPATKAVDDCTVTFSYKDYRKGARKMEMFLEAMEFIRRFYTRGFVRIRHYDILSS